MATRFLARNSSSDGEDPGLDVFICSPFLSWKAPGRARCRALGGSMGSNQVCLGLLLAELEAAYIFKYKRKKVEAQEVGQNIFYGRSTQKNRSPRESRMEGHHPENKPGG